MVKNINTSLENVKVIIMTVFFLHIMIGNHSDVEDDWCRDDLGSSLKLCGALQPLSEGQRKKLGLVEMVLYNMASLLASFASGFDVRISNVVPPIAHPRLQNLAQITPGEFTELEAKMHNSPLYKNIFPRDQDLINIENIHLNRLYGLETYHGYGIKPKTRYYLIIYFKKF